MRPHCSKRDDGRDIREGILRALRSVALPMRIRHVTYVRSCAFCVWTPLHTLLVVTKRLIESLFIIPEGWPDRSPIWRTTMNSYKVAWLCHAG